MVRGRQERELVAEVSLINLVHMVTWTGYLEPVCGDVDTVGERF